MLSENFTINTDLLSVVLVQQLTLVNEGVYELRSNHYFILIHLFDFRG